MVGEGPANRDALHGRTRRIHGTATDLVVGRAGAAADAAYAKAWEAAELHTANALAEALRDTPEFVEPKATAVLAQKLQAGAALMVANSMPVRDLEYFWPANARGTAVFFSRGANGIDGTLSTALGVAHAGGEGRPTVLLTGDLALLHDTNGFLTAPHLNGSLTIILVNNNGGGIFNHLPVSRFEPPFEKYWATPQAVDFARLCSAYGIEHAEVRDAAELGNLVGALPKRGVRVLEVRTDRARDVAWRKRVFATGSSR